MFETRKTLRENEIKEVEKIDACLKLTGELWNLFISIENKHSMDEQETCTNIHDIQNRLLAIACRNNYKIKTKLK